MFQCNKTVLILLHWRRLVKNMEGTKILGGGNGGNILKKAYKFLNYLGGICVQAAPPTSTPMSFSLRRIIDDKTGSRGPNCCWCSRIWKHLTKQSTCVNERVTNRRRRRQNLVIGYVTICHKFMTHCGRSLFHCSLTFLANLLQTQR